LDNFQRFDGASRLGNHLVFVRREAFERPRSSRFSPGPAAGADIVSAGELYRGASRWNSAG